MNGEHGMADGSRTALFRIVYIIAALLLVIVNTKALGREVAHFANTPAQMNRGPEMFCGERLLINCNLLFPHVLIISIIMSYVKQ